MSASYQENYLRDQILEMYRWSLTEHEQRFCGPGLYWYRYYKNYVDKRMDPDDYRSNIGVGLGFPIVEITHARLMEPWNSGRLIQARSLQQEGEKLAPVVAGHINNVLQNKVTRGMAKCSLAMKSTLILGRGVIKHRKAVDRPRSVAKAQRIQLPGILGQIMDMGRFVLMQPNRPKPRYELEYVDPFNCWGEPGVRFNVENGNSFIFERYYATTSAVYAEVEAGTWRPPEARLEPGSGQGYDDFTLRRMDSSSSWGDQPRSGGQGPKLHRIVEFNGRAEIKETRGSTPKYGDIRAVIRDEDEFLQVGQLDTWNGRPPYTIWQPTLDPLSDRPIGMIEPLEDMLLTVNDFVNIALDNARKIIESPLLIDPGAGGGQRLVLGPAAQNFIRNPAFSVKALEMKDLPRSFYELLGWFNDLIQRISGVSDFFGGLNTSDTDKLTKTATGMSLMASLSASRFGPMLTSVDHDFYRKIATEIMEFERLYMDASKIVRVPNSPLSPYGELSPMDLEQEFEYFYSVRGLDPAEKDSREEFVEMMSVWLEKIAPGLQIQGMMPNFYEATRVLFERFDQGQEVERLIQAMTPEAKALLEQGNLQQQGSQVPGEPGPPMGEEGAGFPPPPPGGPAGAAGMPLQQIAALGK